MRKALLTTFLLLVSAGFCWAQMPLTELYLDNFRMVPAFGDPTILDDFELGTNDWWDPDGSGSTYGIFYDTGEDWYTNSTVFVSDTLTVYDGLRSAMLAYQWEHPDSAGLVREYAAPGTHPQTYQFSNSDKLEVWLHGNASGDLFRFCVDDSDGHEASIWLSIDWTGWQLVSWDLAVDSVEAWVGGNGVLDGPMVDFDSFQILKAEATDIQPQSMGEVPGRYSLAQNYPNPFNAQTQIQFTVGETGHISLRVYNVMGQLVKTLVDGEMDTGEHRTVWNGTDENDRALASGIYFCRMEAGEYTESIKMTFLR
ncbi:T9SS type A sorting domain-containing protein [bacterium]|nr:T9SS type A sorting domain-containing protein [bacterium]